MNYFNCLVAIGHITSGQIKIAHMARSDIPSVANMIINTFEGPYDWWQQPIKSYLILDQNAQLENRHDKMILSKQHSMFVAKNDDKIVGFIEVGVVPVPKALLFNPALPSGESSPLVSMIINSTHLPLIGNLIVNEFYRKQGIASNLLTSVEMEVCSWNGNTALLCAVTSNNIQAKRLYMEKFNFQLLAAEPMKNKGMNREILGKLISHSSNIHSK
eukprot:gene12402-26092_t